MQLLLCAEAEGIEGDGEHGERLRVNAVEVALISSSSSRSVVALVSGVLCFSRWFWGAFVTLRASSEPLYRSAAGINGVKKVNSIKPILIVFGSVMWVTLPCFLILGNGGASEAAIHGAIRRGGRRRVQRYIR